jgi:hypothetical protein
MQSYLVYMKADGTLHITSDLEKVGTYTCMEIFDRLEEVLRLRGYRLVYYTKRNHEERVYKRGSEVMILIYRECIIRTNVDRRNLESMLREAVYMPNPIGIM